MRLRGSSSSFTLARDGRSRVRRSWEQCFRRRVSPADLLPAIEENLSSDIEESGDDSVTLELSASYSEILDEAYRNHLLSCCCPVSIIGSQVSSIFSDPIWVDRESFSLKLLGNDGSSLKSTLTALSNPQTSEGENEKVKDKGARGRSRDYLLSIPYETLTCGPTPAQAEQVQMQYLPWIGNTPQACPHGRGGITPHEWEQVIQGRRRRLAPHGPLHVKQRREKPRT